MTIDRGMYEEMVLDHNRNPRNFLRQPAASTHHARGFNPICNDEFEVHLRIRGDVIEDIGFEGAGCAISTASASMMTDAVKGKTVAHARQLFCDMHELLTGKTAIANVGKPAILAGVHEYPLRVKCATLGWHVLNAALEQRKDTVSTEEDEPTLYCPLPEEV